MRAPVNLIKRLSWLRHLKNKGQNVEEALEKAHKKLDKFWRPNVREEKQMGKKEKKGMVRIYEVYEGVAKPSNLYIDPETGLVVVKKSPKEKEK